MPPIKTFYRQNLPHIQPIGATFFVTFRLFGSIPYAALRPLRASYLQTIAKIKRENTSERNMLLWATQLEYFEAFDTLLDQIKSGPMYLQETHVADLVAEEIHRFDGALYQLICFCIMSNHVHLLIDTSLQVPEDWDGFDTSLTSFQPLDKIMKRIKGPTAVYANRVLGRSGQFWHRESFDRYIRNNREFNNVIHYILNNPVKAGLVDDWAAFGHTYYAHAAK